MNNIDKSWNELFDEYEINLDCLYQNKTDIIYPKKEDVFKVFQMPVDEIKLVMLSQDPYIRKNQATGIAFSVPKNIAIPPSLRNIFQEIKNEFPDRKYNFTHGDIEKSWFKREKIFLLNSALTVICGISGSHMHLWQEFTDDVIQYISEKNKTCAFLLLGNFAKSKSQYIQNKDNIITGVHPSPFSANNGFFNSDVFKKVEAITDQINWNEI